jgi:hypothetical protein
VVVNFPVIPGKNQTKHNTLPLLESKTRFNPGCPGKGLLKNSILDLPGFPEQ